MKSTLRTAIAAAIATLPLMAGATSSLIDFELGSLEQYGQVGNAYAATTGVSFTNETHSEIITSDDLSSWVDSQNGAKAYWTSFSTGASFTLEVDATNFQYDTLNLIFWGQLKVTVFDTNGASFVLETGESRLGWNPLNEIVLDASQFGLIDSIQFETSGLGAKEFAIDNIDLSLARTVIPVPTPAPEPGTLGLAALALLGVAATRRRRS